MHMSAADLKFTSDNQKIEGFSGRISDKTASHCPNMDEIAESAAKFKAQIPTGRRVALKPRINRFGAVSIQKPLTACNGVSPTHPILR
jgi:hypothetical protein